VISAVLDHLWQSTIVALGAGVLAMALRKARASVRFGLWFAASLKFLVPFAALAGLGKLLASAVDPPIHVAPEAVFIRQAAQPFSHVYATAPAVQAASTAQGSAHLDPSLVFGLLWALGSAVVLAVWMRRWGSVRAAVARGILMAFPAPMPVLGSKSLSEPGLVGLWRPVLLVPLSLFDHLSRQQITALVAHEAEHLRRRDNLMAVAHMLVEALFWFHPLVWWIGARLIEERERACDEAVVQAGHDRATYARSLLESCRLYLQSPLPCVAGASGSNLKDRVQRIMTGPACSSLSPPVKVLLFAAGVCAFASPVAAGLMTSPGRFAGALAEVGTPALEPVLADRRPSDAPLAAVSASHEAAKAARPGRMLAGRPAQNARPSDEPVVAELQRSLVVLTQPSAVSLLATPAVAQAAAVSPPEVTLSRRARAVDVADQLVCQSAPITGSRFVKRVCESGLERSEAQRRLYAYEREKLLDPSGYPAMSAETPSAADLQ
jgi:beta-lactamase regulating signal transducer with metallopeptidase domain